MLSALRFPVEHSRGRRYPEPEHPYRNPFQRDRDRVIHTRSFRRLEAKTQVFAPGLSDHFRNRLTHTLEVSQIARTAASLLGLDTDLTEALALAHDIGHPPFAHAGEEELDRRMRSYGSRFDHNQQALRIVESLENRYARFPGLNLTFEVREGIVKHSRDIEPGDSPELDEYLPGLRPPLEAQLIDLADEIAYNTADLDDAFSADLLSADDIAGDVPEYAAILETVETQFPGATGREKFHEALRLTIDRLVSGLIEGTAQAARECGAQDADDVRRVPRRIAAFTPDTERANRGLKQFLHRNVYSSPALAGERTRAASMIGELFDLYAGRPSLMPAHYQEMAASSPLHRVVCDYIAGMTDAFFLRTYAREFNPPPV